MRVTSTSFHACAHWWSPSESRAAQGHGGGACFSCGRLIRSNSASVKCTSSMAPIWKLNTTTKNELWMFRGPLQRTRLVAPAGAQTQGKQTDDKSEMRRSLAEHGHGAHDYLCVEWDWRSWPLSMVRSGIASSWGSRSVWKKSASVAAKESTHIVTVLTCLNKHSGLLKCALDVVVSLHSFSGVCELLIVQPLGLLVPVVRLSDCFQGCTGSVAFGQRCRSLGLHFNVISSATGPAFAASDFVSCGWHSRPARLRPARGVLAQASWACASRGKCRAHPSHQQEELPLLMGATWGATWRQRSTARVHKNCAPLVWVCVAREAG